MDTAALVDRMVDSYNRHDIDALAVCYAPGARGQAMLETRMTGTNKGPFVLGEIDRLILGTHVGQRAR